jgi:lipopolysaccharide assembly protein A
MRYLIWILKFVLFALVLAFALKNTELVTVRYYFGGEWQSPLVFVLLVTFCAGVAVGLAAALSTLFAQRRQISTLKRALDRSAQDARQPAQLVRS